MLGNYEQASSGKTIKQTLFGDESILMDILRNRKSLFGIIVFAVFIAIAIAGHFVSLYYYNPASTKAISWLPPSSHHYLGTDFQGHDVLSQFLYGTGVSMYVGFTVAVIAVAIGTAVGLAAGYYGGWTDNLLMRAVDILLILPTFPLLVILSAYLPPTTNTTIFILAILGWPFMSRVIRSQILTIKERPFIKAARLAGMTGPQIMRKEMFMHVLPLVVINTVYSMVGAIVAQAGLAFFGLGNINSINWGTMLYYAQNSDAILYSAWWWILPPGIAIAIIGIGANFFGNGVTEVFGRKAGEV